MLSCATFNRRFGSLHNRGPAAAVSGSSRQLAIARAAPAVAPGAYPTGVLDALERYGGHAKAAYILFEKWDKEEKANGPGSGKFAVERANGQLDQLVTDCKDSHEHIASLKGYTWISSMWGYATFGNVLGTTTADADNSLIISKKEAEAGQVDGKRKPTYLGYIAQGTGADGKEEMLVSFRGTSVQSDWIMNLIGGVGMDKEYQDDATSASAGKVHHGFHALVHDFPDNCTLAETPITAIDRAMQGYKSAHEDSFPQRIIVTGHSLGGALATLAAAHIATCYDEFREENDKYTERRLQVYTLAAPRVGDEQLCSHFKDELGLTAVQMKNELDPTPYVAPYAKGDNWTEVTDAVGKFLHREEKQMEYKLAELAHPHPPAAAAAAAPPAADAPAAGAAAAPAAHVPAAAGTAVPQPATPEAVKERYEGLISAAASFKEAAEAAKNKGWFDSFLYLIKLGHTVWTHWVDSPAPEFGIPTFSSDETGKYGGAMHSIEVYLKHLNELKQQPAGGASTA